MQHRKTMTPCRSLPSYEALEAQITRLTEERDALAAQLKQQKNRSPRFVKVLQNYRSRDGRDVRCDKGDVYPVVSADERHWRVWQLERSDLERLYVRLMPRGIARNIDSTGCF